MCLWVSIPSRMPPSSTAVKRPSKEVWEVHKSTHCCVVKKPCATFRLHRWWYWLPCSHLLIAETQQSCSSTPPSLLRLPYLAAIQIFNASFTRSSLCLIAQSKTWVSCQSIGWSCLQACLPMVDFSNCPQLQASSCSCILDSSVTRSSLCMPFHMCKDMIYHHGLLFQW